ncbi:MAG: hypothetical protein ACOC7J_04760, partial [Armatimonadota bacterium]
MRGRTSRLIPAAIICLCITGLLSGCGGGGGGGTAPPPPPVEIGPGPGPAAEQIPAAETISTVAARTTDFATAPRADLARQAAIDRIERIPDDPPDTEAELRALLADFTGWVTQEPDDAVSQAGLAVAIVLAGAYNAGIDAGYTSDQVLGLLDPITQIASASSGDRRSGQVAA